MKRCPKCNRTFPEDSQKFCTVDGGLLITEQNFDPNMTIRATSAELGLPREDSDEQAATSRKLPDMSETIAVPSAWASAPRPASPASPAGPTSHSRIEISSERPSPQPPPRAPARVTGSLPEKKKSKLPLILGILAVLLILGVAGIAAAFFFVIKPRLDEMDRPVAVRQNPPAEVSITNNTANSTDTAPPSTVTEDYVPPADATKFANSKDNLDGKLADHYVDFTFYYPSAWQTDPRAGVAGASNFAKVQKTLEDESGNYLIESATVSWYKSNGTFESDLAEFPSRAKDFSSQIAGSFPGYEKVSEGVTQINSLQGYEFRFQGVFQKTGKGDLPYWGRTIFLPPGIEGGKSGVVIVMLATSLASGISSVQDVGQSGEMPLILESFRFGKKQ